MHLAVMMISRTRPLDRFSLLYASQWRESVFLVLALCLRVIAFSFSAVNSISPVCKLHCLLLGEKLLGAVLYLDVQDKFCSQSLAVTILDHTVPTVATLLLCPVVDNKGER